MKRSVSLWVMLFFWVLPVAGADQKGIDFFEAKIRPMLVKHCYACHSAGASAKKKLKGGFLLDSRAGIRKGGESGPGAVPGKPADSLIISALRQETFQMPPTGKLPDEIIADFVRWIEMGAPDPRDGVAVLATSGVDLESGRQHWSFQPLVQPVLPEVQGAEWIRTPIDRFVRLKQEQAGVTPNSMAEGRVLIRRAYFDLIGLPPSPDEVDRFSAEFEKDPTGAYRRLIDTLLADEAYGERWARHWLDIVRFAESNGYAFDGDRPHAWHYRDFVISALNSDMPYDQFVRLQIAGDLLTDLDIRTTQQAKAAVGTVAATGFLMAGPFTTQQTQKERERSRYEQLDDMVSTLGTSLLGLTVGCSRCHSHKFDPLPQFDYYRMISCFAEVGFTDTGINVHPEAYREAKNQYDAVHTPLIKDRTRYEQDMLPDQFKQWVTRVIQQRTAARESLKLDVWHHAGPFPEASFENAFEKIFPPEMQVDLNATYLEGRVNWTPHPDWKDGTVHNTLNGENAANYLFRIMESGEDQTVSLSLGRDDAIKVWMNGKLVLEKLASESAAAGQDVVDVPIHQGRNELLIKIINQGGPSGFYFTVNPLRTAPVPVIGSWYHVGPFTAADFNAAFDQVFGPERDSKLDRSFLDGQLKWSEQPDWNDGKAHNDKLTGTNCVNYLFRVIDSPSHQVLSLSLGSDDGVKLWVNGREVLSKKVNRTAAAKDQERTTIQIGSGRNELLMKIVNAEGPSGFYFSVSAAQAPDDVQTIVRLSENNWSQEQKTRLIEWHKGFDLGWLRLNQIVKRSEILEPKPDLTHVYSARVRGTTYQFGEDTYKVYQLRRGNVDNKEQEATPGFLQVLMRSGFQEQKWLTDPEGTDKRRPGRLGLSDWLSDVKHGAGHLMARVIVNRIWHHHFGRGIVATPSDFGTRGEEPSHPDLLDWLAYQLVHKGWSLKTIHRQIMTSAVYMQAGEVTASGRERDPENLLLWRRNTRRLEAETIRDALLAVSGTLDNSIHGKGTLDTRSSRRSVYFTVKRSQLIPLLQLFDAPDTMQGIATREQSTVAPQALAILNSPIIRELASKFAKRIHPHEGTSIEQTVNRAYQIALSRPPSEEEITSMKAFIQHQVTLREEDDNRQALAVRDFCHLILCLNEFVYIE